MPALGPRFSESKLQPSLLTRPGGLGDGRWCGAQRGGGTGDVGGGWPEGAPPPGRASAVSSSVPGPRAALRPLTRVGPVSRSGDSGQVRAERVQAPLVVRAPAALASRSCCREGLSAPGPLCSWVREAQLPRMPVTFISESTVTLAFDQDTVHTPQPLPPPLKCRTRFPHWVHPWGPTPAVSRISPGHQAGTPDSRSTAPSSLPPLPGLSSSWPLPCGLPPPPHLAGSL